MLRTRSLAPEVEQQLLALGGRDTRMHQRHRLYVDIVSSGLPFLAHVPVWHPLAPLNQQLRHFDVEVLDVVDVVVSKLKRFSANDRSDIAAMIGRDLVPHERLVARFKAAVESFADGAGGGSLPQFIANLNRIEEDEYGVDPSVIELPRWLDG